MDDRHLEDSWPGPLQNVDYHLECVALFHQEYVSWKGEVALDLDEWVFIYLW